MRLYVLAIVILITLLISGCHETPRDIAEDDGSFATRPAVYSNEDEGIPATIGQAEGEVVEDIKKDMSSVKTITISAFQFGYDPETITVDYGDDILLTVVSLDVAHGFALPDFGLNFRVPAEESVQVRFTADRKGEFEYFNSVYSGKGWKEMRGKFIVR